MPQSFSWFALLGLMIASDARAQEVPAPAPAPAVPPAAATPSVAPDAAAPAAPPAAQDTAAPPAARDAAAPPAAFEPVQQKPTGFPETRYEYRRAGRLPPPQLYAVEPRKPRRYGDAGAPLAIGIGGNYRFRDDEGYDQLGAGDRQTELDLFVSYDLLQPIAPLVIAAGVNYRYGSEGGDLSVTTHGIVADVTARYSLASWLFPHLRVALGVQTAKLEAASSAYGVDLSDKTTSPLGNLGAGFTLRTPARLFETDTGRCASLSLGVLVEAGYLFARAASFEATPESDSEVPQQSIPLGKLDQASPYLRLVGVVRF